jgi:hydrogenase-4 component E
MPLPANAFLVSLGALTGAAFLLTALATVAARQLLTCFNLFILQSFLLSVSAALLGAALGSPHLLAVAGITVATKTIMIPWLLRKTVHEEVYRIREIDQVLNIPTSLLIALALTGTGYLFADSLGPVAASGVPAFNLPIGVAVMLLGMFTLTVRREAIAQALGLLVAENGVFFAGIAIVPNLPVIAELAAAVDVPVFTLVIGLLTRRIHATVSTTMVGRLAALRED